MNRLKSVSATLRAVGKRLPTQDEFEAVWGGGELSAFVPTLDLDSHEALVQGRMRDLTEEDTKNGIELEKLNVVHDEINIIKASAASPISKEQLNRSFDSMLGVSGDIEDNYIDTSELVDEDPEYFTDLDGSGVSLTAEELKELDEQIEREDRESAELSNDNSIDVIEVDEIEELDDNAFDDDEEPEYFEDVDENEIDLSRLNN